MKIKIFCVGFVLVTLFLLIVVLFFRDRVLFLLAGYDYKLAKSTSVEAFKANAAIYKWRMVLFGLTFLSATASIILCRRMEKISPHWGYTAGKFLGIAACILMTIIFIIHLIIPKRVF